MESSFKLVICISSTALFDCSESHEIWKRDGLEAYKRYQCEHADIPLKPGVGFSLVQSLLELNKVTDRPVVDIVLVSRNDVDSGQRIIDSITYYKLLINQMSFTGGTNVTKYLRAWKCDLFLSTEENQVKEVLAGVNSDPCEGIAAGLVYNMIPEPLPVQPTIS
jgi:5'-nucleotidase